MESRRMQPLVKRRAQTGTNVVPESGLLLRRWTARSDAAARLVLISHAGGGAATYRFMADALEPEIECHSVQLPGREDRFAELPAASLTEIAQALAGEILRTIAPPYAIFGHSMGGIIKSRSSINVMGRFRRSMLSFS
jgi:surfactin synthase thioesterase subunit